MVKTKISCILSLVTALTVATAVADNVAFFYALEADFQKLKSEGTVARQPIKIGSRSIETIVLGKHKIYCVKMGSGTVETAVSSQALLSRFRCDRAYSLGPVGGISDDLQIGRWYVIGSVTNYQKGNWTNSGFQLGKESMSKSSETTEKVTVPSLFREIPSISVASGEVFVASTRYREELRERTKAVAVDMNLFGLITVCNDHHVPLTNWRIVSDKADDNASTDFRRFVETYDGAGGKAVAELIRNLPPNPNSPQSYPNLQKLLQPNETPKK